LDKELEKRGLRFVRYADDCVIYVRSPKAADRVKRSVTRFIHRKLKLVVNEEKSKVSGPWHGKYLGFRITRFMGHTRIGIHGKSLRRFRERVCEITARKRGRTLTHVVGELNEYLRGWAEYFGPGLPKTLMRDLDQWIRRRLRAYVWSQWKRPSARVRNLKARGTHEYWANLVGNTRKGPWHLSKNGTLCAALPDSSFTHLLGLVPLGLHCPQQPNR
jgi:RNA-directed DNA polymerase